MSLCTVSSFLVPANTLEVWFGCKAHSDLKATPVSVGELAGELASDFCEADQFEGLRGPLRRLPVL